jgi:hypothetical protein
LKANDCVVTILSGVVTVMSNIPGLGVDPAAVVKVIT